MLRGLQEAVHHEMRRASTDHKITMSDLVESAFALWKKRYKWAA